MTLPLPSRYALDDPMASDPFFHLPIDAEVSHGDLATSSSFSTCLCSSLELDGCTVCRTYPRQDQAVDLPRIDSPHVTASTSTVAAQQEVEVGRWDVAARKKHSKACMGKSRLNVENKVEIVCLYYSSAASSRYRRPMRQRDISRMYGKSRAAISKLLRPEYAFELMMTAEGLKVRNRSEVLENIKQDLLKGSASSSSPPSRG
ncbi:hypothetical protein GUITHDRAFT_104935 [Guillardia theta CCMP2712]|uniref:Uncharacterized protein n=1 Tax=Guillardia theta (strain CCMP2712) TaxID=905079 RepID=L1JMI2_GUITC|nr:hypothetical protein GUITHDRAFT_104935 [Guillardia theta CCMP2712]EKX49405.1 hypothetical protein GUITHDRAFT_104935 [Guillardia theta CCMP2712]|eukprot:XP_005836385.1 hypothetical protein GUITHDRAFT_104935 [Guillardia theta CCMP2712]